MRPHSFVPRVAIASLGVALAATVARAQDTERVSVDSAGNQVDDDSYSASLSFDGSVVVFTSAAKYLVPPDTNQSRDVFVHDRTTGTTERVSVDSGGTEANGNSHVSAGRSLSGDGRVVAFESAASNLVASDTNGSQDIFVHDRSTGITTLVSVDSSGNQGNGSSIRVAISADGKVVAFISVATNLVAGDTNGAGDVFVHDLTSGLTERVSVDSLGNEADGDSYWPSLSADGRYVAFSSYATNLVAGDTNLSYDVFVRDRVLGTTERVSVDASGNEGDQFSLEPSISGDGRYVAFASSASNLVPSDTNHNWDVFLVDRAAGTIVRCSVKSSGLQANNDSGSAFVSPSGAFVAFRSAASNLVANDGNFKEDCFIRDVQAGTTTRVSVDSSGGEANGDCADPSISGDDMTLALDSGAANLVSSDTNYRNDVFVHERCSASRSNYGSGLAGTNGVPSLAAGEDPVLGSTLSVTVANSLGAPTLGFMLIGLERDAFKTKFGADVLVKPVFLIPIPFSSGANTFTGTLPSDAAYCGTTIDLQVLELDAGAPFGVSFTDGLELDLGR